MNISPRNAEVDAVLAVFTQAHASKEALAKALIKALWAQLLDREFYVYALRFAGGATTLPFGPFTTPNEATKFANKIALDTGEQHVIVRVFGPKHPDALADMHPWHTVHTEAAS